MIRYDPATSPKPDKWLSLDEDQAIMLVERYHRESGERFPNLRVHALLHVIVENQLAMRIPQVESAYNRMLAEGLDRHQAVHAVSSVLAGHIHAMLSGKKTEPDLNQAYYRDLDALTAEQWWALGDKPLPLSRKAQRLRHRRPWK